MCCFTSNYLHITRVRREEADVSRTPFPPDWTWTSDLLVSANVLDYSQLFCQLNYREVTPSGGLEPPTDRLTAWRSTNWAKKDCGCFLPFALPRAHHEEVGSLCSKVPAGSRTRIASLEGSNDNHYITGTGDAGVGVSLPQIKCRIKIRKMHGARFELAQFFRTKTS